MEFVEDKCREYGVNVALSEVWAKGGEGGIELAKEVIRMINEDKSNFKFIYEESATIKDKIETIAREIYGADGVDFTPAALKEINKLGENGFAKLPVCMAKTQYSLSDDPKKLGWPKNYNIAVRNVYLPEQDHSSLTGEIMTMPGLPNACYRKNDVDASGKISGLF